MFFLNIEETTWRRWPKDYQSSLAGANQLLFIFLLNSLLPNIKRFDISFHLNTMIINLIFDIYAWRSKDSWI